MKYWKQFYNSKRLVGSSDFQKNVGRTKNGKVISKKLWDKTLLDMKNLIAIEEGRSEILELCCGNGQIIGRLASKCKSAVGVDFSDILLKQLRENFGDNIKTISGDIRGVKFENNSFDIIILYFSLQYFNEKEVIELIAASKFWLRKNGKLYIGDIPDMRRKWDYINLPKDRKNYIKRVLDAEPLIGNWFHPDFFNAISNSIHDISVEIIEQPDYHINSDYRFDVLVTRN